MLLDSLARYESSVCTERVRLGGEECFHCDALIVEGSEVADLGEWRWKGFSPLVGLFLLALLLSCWFRKVTVVSSNLTD